jgi:hypothetical protein
LNGWVTANARALGKWVRSFDKDDIYSTAHQRQQYPSLAIADIEDRVSRLRASLDRFQDVTVREVIPDIFLLER